MPEPTVVRRAAAQATVSSELAKATILNTFTGESFRVMYNPEELKLEQGNTFAEIGIPGLGTPPVQYVRGKARTLSMELFFDTYETGEDVRAYTAPIVRLLDKNPQTLAPPVLLFSLGRLQFRCVLTDAGQRFTMFARDGTPVRSTMSVRLQEYVDVTTQVRQGVFLGSPTLSGAVTAAVAAASPAAQIPGSPAQAPVVHIVGASDTLSGIAAAHLGDPGRWREVALANGIVDPLRLTVGAGLVIPATAASPPGRAS